MNTGYHCPMFRHLLALIVILPLVGRAQESSGGKGRDHSDLEGALSFELQPVGDVPGGWNGVPPGTVFTDNKVFHGGRASVRFERQSGSPSSFSAVTRSLPIDFGGATIELRGFLRTEDVSDFAGLWLREDGESAGTALAFDNMQARQLKGTTDWKEYSISLPLHSE